MRAKSCFFFFAMHQFPPSWTVETFYVQQVVSRELTFLLHLLLLSQHPSFGKIFTLCQLTSRHSVNIMKTKNSLTAPHQIGLQCSWVWLVVCQCPGSPNVSALPFCCKAQSA